MSEEFPKIRYDVIVIGGGPAGIISAIETARAGLSVCIIEKNKSIGRKLMITGKGRCNLTTAVDRDELIASIPENGRFVYSCLNEFSNFDIIDYFNKLGVKTVIERGNRVFPESGKAQDVKEALLKELKKNKVKIYYETSATEILTENGRVMGVSLSTNEMKVYSDRVILATGGKSYPLTGSTGDGYVLAGRLGHHVTDLYPGLVGLKTKEKFVRNLSGLTLKNANVKMYAKDKLIYQDFGELLFTNQGVSGPTILSSTFELYKYNYEGIKLEIDLKPALTNDQLFARIKRDFEKNNRKIYANSLSELLPKSLIPVFVKLSEIKADKIVSEISNNEILNMVKLLKCFTLNICGYTSFDEAIVTIGGVMSREISPKTMESKLVKGLYIVGELLDVTGYTGGFNLTIAFSTGYSAAKDIINKTEA